MKNLTAIVILSMLILFFSTSCSDERQATNSLEGNWEIQEVTTFYGTFTDSSAVINESIVDSGMVGTILFDKDEVRYDYVRNDSTFVGNSTWELTTERVNEGFTRITEFTLSIDELGDFLAFFGDRTSNSEKNANYVRLTKIPVSTKNIAYTFILVKID